ncbi:MAG: xanthine phosphoribosyltransferase [Clostridiales bacterium]|nr:xanthine phosphoribosyltransferase [Clostridiales bacterium]
MELLKQRIEKDGNVKMPNIVKVDSFLNHQIDVALLDEIGAEFYRRFKDKGITKIVTIEASGIAIACSAARHFKVPVVFAKKHENKTMDDDVYQVTIHSFTKGKDYEAKISKKFLDSSDTVLIIDDFLANGEAAKGLVAMVKMSGAETAGIGIVIEKGFQNGGEELRNMGYNVESLAVIENIKENTVIFKK